MGYQPYYSDLKREAERIARESAPRYEPAQASNQAQAQHSGRERSGKNVVHIHSTSHSAKHRVSLNFPNNFYRNFLNFIFEIFENHRILIFYHNF